MPHIIILYNEQGEAIGEYPGPHDGEVGGGGGGGFAAALQHADAQLAGEQEPPRAVFYDRYFECIAEAVHAKKPKE